MDISTVLEIIFNYLKLFRKEYGTQNENKQTRSMKNAFYFLRSAYCVFKF